MDDLQTAEHEDTRLDGLPVYYKATAREKPQSLIVFMPAALPGKRVDRTKRIYSRFSWNYLWPTSEIMAFADPALQQSEKLNGAWFIHPKHDIIHTIATISSEYAETLGIAPGDITFYGSSLGGFGAIAAASCIEGARAVAEVPQIDFANWLTSAVSAIETNVAKMPIEEYHKLHPEQLKLQDRLLHSARIPGIRLITNPEERHRDEQYEFFSWARNCDLPKSGPFEFIETTEVSGHAALPKTSVRSLLGR